LISKPPTPSIDAIVLSPNKDEVPMNVSFEDLASNLERDLLEKT
jgi:hypothetical protein